MKKTILLTLAAAVLLAACGDDTTQSNSETDLKATKELVQSYSEGSIQAENASITSEHLIVQETDGEEKVYELPEEEFFVSIALYVKNTHPCTIHNLTSCQGELANEEFDVTIIDSEGKIVTKETMKSPKNGFLDLWLPREKEYQVRIEHNGKVAESKLTTFKEDGTCVTSMQLL
ncbi:CueP family metal-binding protein [Bacillus sp. 2205SS5-2]|uniref:CueP family metal-binding protein n=1 Tax=Bacillus sp. 2205SS5-2 TaxID=3109031 RepID=UPI0030068292